MKHRHDKIRTVSDVQKYKSKSEKPLLVFVFMVGCPFCDMMMPEWHRAEAVDFVDTIMVDHMLLNEMKKTNGSLMHIQPNGYPHIELLPDASVNKGLRFNGERNTLHFIDFVKKNTPKASVKQTVQKSASKKTPATKATKKTKSGEKDKKVKPKSKK